MTSRATEKLVAGAMLWLVATGVAPARADHELARGGAWLGTGYSIFGATRASLRDPHFGMRVFGNTPVDGTLDVTDDPAATDQAAASRANDSHVFWDVAFGESMPIWGWYDVRDEALVRYARGVQVNLDAGAFMLLDFSSQSAGVINTDYRLGLSVDGRPPWPYAERFSVKIGGFHQSTHLGDEYVLSARTVQRQDAPAVNGVLPFRANPSFNAVPITASWDWSPRTAVAVRLYGGTMLFLSNAIAQADHPEFRAGAEVQFDRLVDVREPAKVSPRDVENLGAQATPKSEPAAATVQETPARPPDDFLDAIEQFGFGHSPIGTPVHPPSTNTRYRRGPLSVALKYELLLQRRFGQIGGQPGPATFASQEGFWQTHHVMLLVYLNTRTRHSSSNALVVGAEWIRGRNQHGQLVAYHELNTVAGSLSYYW